MVILYYPPLPGYQFIFLFYVHLSLSTNVGTELIVKLMITFNIYSILNFILTNHLITTYLKSKNHKIKI